MWENNFHIVSDTTMPIPLILGRDFLNKFNIRLCQKLIKNILSNKWHEFFN